MKRPRRVNNQVGRLRRRVYDLTHIEIGEAKILVRKFRGQVWLEIVAPKKLPIRQKQLK